MDKKNRDNKKRFYKKNERIWIVPKQTDGFVKSINLKDLEVTVYFRSNPDENVISPYSEEATFKIWEIDKMRDKQTKKPIFFAPVNGGVIPTKDEENGGRDAYARLEPIGQDEEGNPIYELYIKQLTLAKIPLGFASYLDKNAVLSLKHERSSIGGLGIAVLSGLIDSTYQGEVILQIVPLTSNILISSKVSEREYDEATNTYAIPYSKAIAQAVVFNQFEGEDTHVPMEFLLSLPSKRKTGKEGSTGK